jgi:hypothetical protein
LIRRAPPRRWSNSNAHASGTDALPRGLAC